MFINLRQFTNLLKLLDKYLKDRPLERYKTENIVYFKKIKNKIFEIII